MSETVTMKRERVELPCINPFCDGYGNLDVSARGGEAWLFGACRVGPHPPTPPDYRPTSRRKQAP
jgi:hypothetical protein